MNTDGPGYGGYDPNDSHGAGLTIRAVSAGEAAGYLDDLLNGRHSGSSPRYSPPPPRTPEPAEPKLAVEIIPTSLHGQNPRTAFGSRWWDATRRPAYAKAGYRCEICRGRGADHPVELHERYIYDEYARPPVQRCTGLIVLCPACHAVKHLYRTGTIAAKTGDQAALDNALRHQREVNGWTNQQQDRYLAQIRRTFERREALGPWTTDFTALYFA